MFTRAHCTQFQSFYWASFGTAHDKSQATPTFCPSMHQTFCTKRWHSGVWRKPAGRKGSVASCGGAEAWQFLGWNSNEWPCSFLLASTGCPPFELEVWVYEGSMGGVCMCGWGCHPVVTESAKYNITTVVGLCGLGVCLFPQRKKSPPSSPSSSCLFSVCNTSWKPGCQ